MTVRTPHAMIRTGRFVRFEHHAPARGRTTPTVTVISKATSEIEGEIRWKGRRGFSLWPAPGTAFGPICLADVQRVIADLAADHEAKR